MTYNPATDLLGLWRNIAGNVSKLEVPGLDYVLSALARAGIISVSVSATAPVANQPVTAWLKTAVPSYSGEGQFFLWDKISATYLAATPGLFLQFLDASATQSGVSWWTTTGGPPANTVGLNGDYAIRTDTPGGVYGPKVGGAWPANPLPGTTNTISSGALDNTFGSTEGLLIYRGPTGWVSLPIGTAFEMLGTDGNAPEWVGLSGFLDGIFTNVQGSILYRAAGNWGSLPPSTANWVLTTNGAGANPNWTPKSSEFSSGCTMIFQQVAAPAGWTKQTTLNDYALRVTAGAVGVTPGTPFSTVFATTAVGNTTLSAAQIPSHTHGFISPPSGQPVTSAGGSAGEGVVGAGTTDFGTGGNAAHTHSIGLSLSYVDVIIATKN